MHILPYQKVGVVFLFGFLVILGNGTCLGRTFPGNPGMKGMVTFGETWGPMPAYPAR